MRVYLLAFSLFAVAVSACASASKTSPDQRPQSGTSVTAEDIDRNPTAAVEDLLSGRIPGVWVTRAPDGGIAIRIRGATSVNGSAEPLYVVDGVPIEPGPGGSLTGIAPNDIASIEVVKDAIGTAMYGIRGANGVIVIKTKRSRH